MNLLFKRAQTDGATGKVKFRLWAAAELDDDEQRIVKRYRFDDAVLIQVDVPNLLRNAAIVALATGLVVMLLLLQMSLGMLIAAAAGLAAGYFYYDRKRESVLVRDLINGRHFACSSVVELARKEAWVKDAVAVFRQVMETAKHWDGTETIPIVALSKEDAKYIALKAL